MPMEACVAGNLGLIRGLFRDKRVEHLEGKFTAANKHNKRQGSNTIQLLFMCSNSKDNKVRLEKNNKTSENVG